MIANMRLSACLVTFITAYRRHFRITHHLASGSHLVLRWYLELVIWIEGCRDC